MESKKRNIVIALCVAMFLGAIEGTVVTTAIPTIVKDLQGFEIMSLLFSVYLLTSAISTPIYGKLSDLYGRKNILSIGIIIFLAGSFLCGLSQNMYMLIAFRALQGMGAGAIFTLPYTIVGDVFTKEENPKVQGMLGTVWGVASLVGPLIGGILTDALSWHWIFFINIPFGILSLILIQRNLEETIEKTKHKIDFAGIITLSIAMAIFLNIFSENKNSNNIFNIISVVITIVLLILFYKTERKAKEPIMPFDIFTKRITIVNLISFLASVILIGANVYLPMYIQNVLGFSALVSGLSMAPMSIAWFISSVVLGNWISKYGAKAVIVISNTILLISTILLTTLGINSPLFLILIYSSIMGFGFGGALTTLTITVQESVGYNKRGAVTATNSLLKSLGETIGIGVFGSIFNLYIVKYFTHLGINGVDPSNLYTGVVTSDQVQLSLTSSMHVLFIIFIIISILSLAITMLMPKVAVKDRKEQSGDILTES